MPTYQYRCQSCANELEAFQKFTDDPLSTCPECGGPLRKLFNAVGIVFKGSGFYATDSRKSSSAAVSANSTESHAAASASGSTSTSDSAGTKTSTATSTPAKDSAAA